MRHEDHTEQCLICHASAEPGSSYLQIALNGRWAFLCSYSCFVEYSERETGIPEYGDQAAHFPRPLRRSA